MKRLLFDSNLYIESDWVEVGRVLQRIGRKYGYEQIGRARLTNDALIAISSGRLG
jgi:hypothetical protein